MSRTRLILLLLFGFGGVAVLLALGQWQLRRLAWKEAILARIEARLEAPPIALPTDPNEAEDEYRRVAVDGHFLKGELHVLTSTRFDGPGFRIIAPFETADGRRIMIDRGFVPDAERDAARHPVATHVSGALLWPDETDYFTPAPDAAKNFWFARDVPPMATALGTEQVMVVADSETPPEPGGPKPLPVTIDIPNDHLQYAITWFALAAAWAVMTGLLIHRTLRGVRRGES